MGKKAALLAVALAVAGLCILLWPVVSGHRLQADMSAAAQVFLEEARQSYPELLADLQEYNQRIYTERQAGLAVQSLATTPAHRTSQTIGRCLPDVEIQTRGLYGA